MSAKNCVDLKLRLLLNVGMKCHGEEKRSQSRDSLDLGEKLEQYVSDIEGAYRVRPSYD